MLAARPAPSRAPVTTAERVRQLWSPGSGGSRGRVALGTFPLKPEEIQEILPRGIMDSANVLPSELIYLYPAPSTASPNSEASPAGTTPPAAPAISAYDVRAVADGTVTVVTGTGASTGTAGTGTAATSYALVVQHSSTCWSYVEGLTEISTDIGRQLGGIPLGSDDAHVRVPVNEGQTLGKIQGRALGFMLVDTRETHNRFVRPERLLAAEPWKPHVLDPFDCVDEPLRKRLLERCRRTRKPLGGRFAYDRDARLAGNWYRESWTAEPAVTPGYTDGRLVFAYHPVDSSVVLLSLGSFRAGPAQFQVRANHPDPSDVSEKSGVTRYDLLYPTLDLRTGQEVSRTGDPLAGVMLVQMIEKRRLRVQVFADKRPDEIRGFTEAAVIYER